MRNNWKKEGKGKPSKIVEILNTSRRNQEYKRRLNEQYKYCTERNIRSRETLPPKKKLRKYKKEQKK